MVLRNSNQYNVSFYLGKKTCVYIGRKERPNAASITMTGVCLWVIAPLCGATYE